MSIPGFERESFRSGDLEHDVYAKGTGPAVLVMHELPGLADPAVRFAVRLIEAGFRVYLPHLFGKLLAHSPDTNYVRLCVSKEFAHLRAGTDAPVANWLRELVGWISQRNGQGTVGVIGMCLTGAFVIPLIIHPKVRAAVAAQPAVPLSLLYAATGIGKGPWMTQLNVSDATLKEAATRAHVENVPVMALRFETDRICVHGKMERLKFAFDSQLEVHELPHGDPSRSHPHATLTEEYDREKDPAGPVHAMQARVVEFLRMHLTGS